jgi:hypothetical protein
LGSGARDDEKAGRKHDDNGETHPSRCRHRLSDV